MAALGPVSEKSLENVRGSDRSFQLASTMGNMLLYFPAVTMSKIFKRKVVHARFGRKHARTQKQTQTQNANTDTTITTLKVTTTSEVFW